MKVLKKIGEFLLTIAFIIIIFAGFSFFNGGFYQFSSPFTSIYKIVKTVKGWITPSPETHTINDDSEMTIELAKDNTIPLLIGNITRIIDGDTVKVKSDKEEYTVRLYGVDAPEKGQPFSEESTDIIRKHCPIDKEVAVYVLGTDKYRRALGLLYCNGTNSPPSENEFLLFYGYAWAHTFFLEKHKGAYPEVYKYYLEYEKNAKDAAINIWSEPNPLPPWEYRKIQRSK